MTAYSPINEVAQVNGRPVFITHSLDDQALSVEYARTLTATIQTTGSAVEYWETQGSRHVQYVFDHPDEYEQRLISFFDSSL